MIYPAFPAEPVLDRSVRKSSRCLRTGMQAKIQTDAAEQDAAADDIF